MTIVSRFTNNTHFSEGVAVVLNQCARTSWLFPTSPISQPPPPTHSRANLPPTYHDTPVLFLDPVVLGDPLCRRFKRVVDGLHRNHEEEGLRGQGRACWGLRVSAPVTGGWRHRREKEEREKRVAEKKENGREKGWGGQVGSRTATAVYNSNAYCYNTHPCTWRVPKYVRTGRTNVLSRTALPQVRMQRVRVPPFGAACGGRCARWIGSQTGLWSTFPTRSALGGGRE